MKEQYNYYLKRYHNMIKWNETATVEERYAQTGLAISVVTRLAYLWNNIEDKTLYNLMNGFSKIGI